VAIKVVSEERIFFSNEEEFRFEVGLTTMLDHANVVKCLGANYKASSAFMVMPLYGEYNETALDNFLSHLHRIISYHSISTCFIFFLFAAKGNLWNVLRPDNQPPPEFYLIIKLDLAIQIADVTYNPRPFFLPTSAHFYFLFFD
jgi:hypothetical protein